MQNLYDYAKHNGVLIQYVDHLNPTSPGDYNNRTHTIRVLYGMTGVKTRSVLAHELGHATYRDVPSIFERYNQRQEDRADEWAAHFLINHDDYRYAEERYGTHTDWIAQELGVLARLVKAYERTLTRIGDTIYVKPTLGTASMKMLA